VGRMRHDLRTALYDYRNPQEGRYPPLVQIETHLVQHQMSVDLELYLASAVTLTMRYDQRMLYDIRGADPRTLADVMCHIYFEFGDVELRGRDIYRVQEPPQRMRAWERFDQYEAIGPIEMHTRNFSSLLRFEGPRNPAMSLAFGQPARPPRLDDYRAREQMLMGGLVFGHHPQRPVPPAQWYQYMMHAEREMRDIAGINDILTGGAPTTPEEAESASPARRKGWALLKQHLTEEQKNTLATAHYFEVTGMTGARYRIRYGGSYNVLRRRLDGTIHELCFLPRGGLCMGDKLLAQKLALELDEHNATAIANVATCHGSRWE
jgi:hypothetical protein